MLLNKMSDKFTHAKVFKDRYVLMEYCSSLIQPKGKIMEVGVFQGYTSEILIKHFNPEKIILMDTFYLDDHWTNKFKKEDHLQFVKDKFKNIPCVDIVQGLSHINIPKLEDRSLDYIYIDADHSYTSVKTDIDHAVKKIKIGGIIQFNDYTNYSVVENCPYGVMDAVNEFIDSNDVSILGIGLHNKGYHDIAVKVNS
jgi:predicted O-methyltransferase YrrM